MKKFLACFACLMMVVVVSLGFVACGGVTGKYKFYGVKIGDMEYKLKDLTDDQKTLYATSEFEGEYIKLNSNDTFEDYTFSNNYGDDKYKKEIRVYGIYEVYDQKLILDYAPKDKHESKEFVIRDGKIYVQIPLTENYYIYKK